MKPVIILMVIFFFSTHASVRCDEFVTMTGEKWAPYNNYIVDRKNPGFMFEIVQAVFKKQNVVFRYTEQPWARAIISTREGKYNALIGPAKGDAPDLIFPEEPIGFTINSFFVRKDSQWTYTGIDSLKRIKLGILKSMTYGAKLDGYIKANQGNRELISTIFGRDYLKRNFIKLRAGRIDATIDDLMVIRYFLQQSDQAGLFREAGTIQEGYGIYIAFSPRYPRAKKMAELVTRGVRALRESGELDPILHKYGTEDWK